MFVGLRGGEDEVAVLAANTGEAGHLVRVTWI